MAVQERTFDTGPDGAAATTANSELDIVVGDLTFASEMAAHGPYGIKCNATSTQHAFGRVTFGETDVFSFSTVLTLPPTQPASGVTRYLWQLQTEAGQTCLVIYQTSDGRLNFAATEGAGATGFANINSGHYVDGGQYRFSVWGDHLAGTAHVRMYDMAGTAKGNARDLSGVVIGDTPPSYLDIGLTSGGNLDTTVVGFDDFRFEVGRTTELGGLVPSEPSGAGVYIFDGTNEIPCSTFIFDGTDEVAASIEI